MISICPKCHHEVEHEDYLFEAVCSCGARFNPFMTTEDSQKGAAAPLPTKQEPSGEALPGAEKDASIRSQAAESFTESSKVFSEIRQFGESLGIAQTVIPTSAKKNTEGLVTPLNEIAGMRITEVVGLVSAVVEIAPTQGQPLDGLVKTLWQACEKKQGNALVGFSWQLFQDGAKVLGSGVVVKVQKDPHGKAP